MTTHKHTLNDKTIDVLCKKFSSPMVNPCISDAQREKAISISKILWLLLVTDTDSEENIYDALNKVINSHEANLAIGSLYFFKMKTALTAREQLKLRKHFSDQENFAVLESWG